MSKAKRAILIAAGMGKRLQPVTLNTPKPLVKIHGKRIIDSSIEALHRNGIEDIYIVTGYKKEQFHEIFRQESGIHLINNPDYLKGNNITSMYYAKDYLPDSLVLEADIIVKNPDILDPSFIKSGYLASWRKKTTEWVLEVEDNHIVKCETNVEKEGYQLWGVSFWNEEDGRKLAEKIKSEYEQGNIGIFWDELALFKYKEDFDLGIREVELNSLQEIDTFEELVQIDETYGGYGGNTKR